MQGTLQNIKVKGGVLIKQNKKQTAETEEDSGNILQDVLKLIDSIWSMRLIQKISRPLQKKWKQEQVKKAANKLQILHQKLQKIRLQIAQKNIKQKNTKNKSVIGSGTNKPITDWKKTIKTIQNKYHEVFFQGSFKFYQKIFAMFSLSTSLIGHWIAYWNKINQTCAVDIIFKFIISTLHKF